MSDRSKSLIKKYAQAAEDAFLKVFEVIPEVIGFLQIMISPFLIGILLGAVFYVDSSVRHHVREFNVSDLNAINAIEQIGALEVG